ncbi:hypothetical protein FQA47_002371 [Oryzias melastigma]|uniref:Uncharacterized protein n=1 Tax=Oryzias melastigma TaxID=30732 RepID=A0A834KYY3_ORYME|nr:hypothetical protein FQA47_002371 [Oryzias melastigma]
MALNEGGGRGGGPHRGEKVLLGGGGELRGGGDTQQERRREALRKRRGGGRESGEEEAPVVPSHSRSLNRFGGLIHRGDRRQEQIIAPRRAFWKSEEELGSRSILKLTAPAAAPPGSG